MAPSIREFLPLDLKGLAPEFVVNRFVGKSQKLNRHSREGGSPFALPGIRMNA
jgi:hypothetical protein